MASSSSSLPFSLTSPSSSVEYDVFPSFHGPDVRNKFFSHVLKEFKSKGINLFIDNDIKRGDFIAPELIKAIKGSKIAVVLLSKNYAASSWCLNELVEIMKQESGRFVISVFYDVDPTHVRKQTGHFGEVFKKTCEGKDNEKIETWRKSLEDVATIAGYHIRDWDNEASMIEKIAVDISNRLYGLTPSREFENYIGLENHCEKLNPLLRIDSNEVIKIGIWGPSGIGKSTIVRFLFSKFSGYFPNSALMEDIKRSYQNPTLCSDKRKAKLQLLQDTLSKLFNQSDIVVRHWEVAQRRLRNNRVFLVLDDVDRFEQIDALAGNDFGPGSRIIFTTQDRRLLKTIGVNHIYKMDFPSSDEALQMFCMYAFQKKTPEDGFDQLACKITHLVGNLPLGLEVMGSFFRYLGKDKKRWSMEVSRLLTNNTGDIESILKFSYDALFDEDKDLFLHIACFFRGAELNEVKKFLPPRFKDLKQRLDVLEEKSLISFEEYGPDTTFIRMHNLLVQLAKRIVIDELVRESGKHKFLNDYRDVCQMLTGKNLTGDYLCEGNIRVTYDSGHPIIIYWRLFPLRCLDSTNNLEFLVELHLWSSNLEKLWEGTKLLQNLKILDLSNSYRLKALPNLSMVTNLEELNLIGCSRLLNLPSSIGNATNLQMLNLRFCSRLVNLPSSIRNATKLEGLDLRGCSRLVSLPKLPESLTNLNAEDCRDLQKLDCSFGKVNWQNIRFRGCFNLNKKARDLIIHTSTHEGVLLPGKEVPACFTYRASGSYLTVKVNQKHLSSSTKFKACILLVGKRKRYSTIKVSCSITSKNRKAITARTPFSKDIYGFIDEHLYIFDIEVDEVTSSELDFTFEVTDKYDSTSGEWEIKECGVLLIRGASCYERVNNYKKLTLFFKKL